MITKSKQSAIQFLELVKLTQQNWIEEGTNWDHPSYKVTPKFTHNVSNTVNVLPDEWDEVMNYLWENKDSFCGISMLPASGDLDYPPQAPFTEVLDEIELAKRGLWPRSNFSRRIKCGWYTRFWRFMESY